MVVVRETEAMELLAKAPSAVLVDAVHSPNGGIYVVYREGSPVYVGHTTKSLSQRLRGHVLKGSLLGEALERGDRLDIRVLKLSGEEEYLKSVEQVLIRKLRPEYNRGGLPQALWTGEAKQRHEERQRDWERRRERLEYIQGVIHAALDEFHSCGVRDAEQAAMGYIIEKTTQLQPGEDVDVRQLGREAFELYLDELAVSPALAQVRKKITVPGA